MNKNSSLIIKNIGTDKPAYGNKDWKISLFEWAQIVYKNVYSDQKIFQAAKNLKYY